MIARHKKMYAGSPRIESDESGKKVIRKGPTDAEKASAEANSGTDSIAGTETQLVELTQKHAKERLELYQRHERDYLDTTHKISKEITPAATDGINDSNEGE